MLKVTLFGVIFDTTRCCGYSTSGWSTSPRNRMVCPGEEHCPCTYPSEKSHEHLSLVHYTPTIKRKCEGSLTHAWNSIIYLFRNVSQLFVNPVPMYVYMCVCVCMCVCVHSEIYISLIMIQKYVHYKLFQLFWPAFISIDSYT